jgi:hypothetical protein
MSDRPKTARRARFASLATLLKRALRRPRTGAPRRSCRASLVASASSLVLAGAALAQAPAGSTLSPDGLGFLVSKDLAGERWAISLSFIPRFDAGGAIASYTLRSVSGNVFPTDGGPPAFVFCEVTAASQGDLGNPGSVFRLRCFGSSACATNAIECAQNDFRVIAEDVAVPASFFLPPGGLGVAPRAKIVQSAGATLPPPTSDSSYVSSSR